MDEYPEVAEDHSWVVEDQSWVVEDQSWVVENRSRVVEETWSHRSRRGSPWRPRGPPGDA